MTRRKREIVGLRNERDFPYLVELALPPGGFRSVFLEIDAFHRERRIPVRRGRGAALRLDGLLRLRWLTAHCATPSHLEPSLGEPSPGGRPHPSTAAGGLCSTAKINARRSELGRNR
jgi:hypothetical protein